MDQYKNASLILTDGKPLLWIANWYGTPIKEKISGSDLFPLLCEMAAEKGYKMFFLGAAEGVAAKAAENLMNRFKGLQVVGTYSPPFGFEKDPVEMDKIKSMIKEEILRGLHAGWQIMGWSGYLGLLKIPNGWQNVTWWMIERFLV